jgi:MoaA/NifB/PqqE/SkfB family radical SAM enzyme
MSGAMAGTALLSAPQSSDYLDTVSLTINNSCNLTCPHCYLQYDPHERSNFIQSETLDKVFDSNARHICIVGKEPLADRRSISITESIIARAHSKDISVSIVTNGTRLEQLSKEALAKLSWIDLSLDGGRRFYEGYRGQSIEPILRAASALRMYPSPPIRVLHTISKDNADHIDDMVSVSDELQAEITLFSPYRATRSHGTQICSMLEPRVLFERLAAGLENAPINFIVGADSHYFAKFPNERHASALNYAAAVFGDRFDYVESDPISRGMIRVTYDGLALSPFESIDMTSYQGACHLSEGHLATHFGYLHKKYAC